MSRADDYRYMAQALRLAERGLYTTDPNPRVGSVIVQGAEIVGEGWHERAGGPHAEVMALEKAGSRASGATAYVTLEPCSHHGRTPPCADALIKAGIKRVVAAMQDPNPLVAGQGLERLRASGIETEHDILAAQARDLNPGFVSRMTRGRPWVRCKLAMSIDGRTAMASGESQWITGPAAREDVHRLRARSAVIMTGIDTVLTDDPSLTVRLEDKAVQVLEPRRVVLDSQLKISTTARVFDDPRDAWVMTTVREGEKRESLQRAGVEVLSVPERQGRVDLLSALELLGEREINEVLLECGSVLSGAMLNAGLVDELVIYMAPKIMGDAAKGLFHLPGLDRMDQNIMVEIKDIRAVGADWRVIAVPGRTG